MMFSQPNEWADVEGAPGVQTTVLYGKAGYRIGSHSVRSGPTTGPCGSLSAKTGERCTNSGKIAIDVGGHRLLLCQAHAGAAVSTRRLVDGGIAAIRRLWSLPNADDVAAALDSARPAIAKAEAAAAAAAWKAREEAAARNGERYAREDADRAAALARRAERADARGQTRGVASTYKTPWETTGLPVGESPPDDGAPHWFPMGTAGDLVVWRRPAKRGRSQVGRGTGKAP